LFNSSKNHYVKISHGPVKLALKVKGMSEEDMPAGIFAIEKIFGLMLIIIGAIITYYTLTRIPTGDAGTFSGIFVLPGVAILGVGILLLIAKTE
jgi:hypothetical protein